MSKKILILTGKLAEKEVRYHLSKYINELTDIKVLDISLAAFITPEIIINSLKKLDLSKYEYIMVPGLMVGDLTKIEKVLNIPVFKGPRHASDIPLIIKNNIELSKELPADRLLTKYKINEYESIIEQINKSCNEKFKIGNLKICNELPPLILAEIVDAPKLSINKIISIAKYYIKNGADMIDIGAIVGQDNSKKIRIIIETLTSKFKDIPISIDSLNPCEIESGVEAGASLVLSIDEGNIDDLKNLNKECCITVIPTNIKNGYFPKNPEERLNKLIENINKAKKYGFTKILADPLLESPINPGFTNSIITYYYLNKDYPEIPKLAGFGNVIELIDSDSIGINAILASMAYELNISVCLTTEYSKKTRFAINELKKALQMNFMANYKNQPPVGLIFNLLKSKSKKDPSEHLKFEIKNEKYLKNNLKELETYIPDPLGYFKIWINHYENKIYVNYYKNNKLIYTISGKNSELIGKELIKLGTISRLDHALYLGRELQKAEICLYLGKTYIQDINFQDI